MNQWQREKEGEGEWGASRKWSEFCSISRRYKTRPIIIAAISNIYFISEIIRGQIKPMCYL